MKKYLFASIAVVLAVFLSSFTHRAPETKTEGLFWYPVQDGLTIDDQYVFEGSKEDAKALPCTDSEVQPVCLYGSQNDALPSNTVVPTNDSDVIIRETEQ